MIQRGSLADYFEGLMVKRLSVVETTPKKSNQHEFNGVDTLRKIFGDGDRKNIPARFVWFGGEQEGITCDNFISWYDARRQHPTRTEYRLYYPSNPVTDLMEAGDSFFLALCKNGTALCIIASEQSTIHNQLIYLFGLEEQPELNFVTKGITPGNSRELDFTVRYIMDELGIEYQEPETNLLDTILEPYGHKFPTTAEFSLLARNSLGDLSSHDDSDTVLMTWLEREEQLFKRLERHIVGDRIKNGFMADNAADVDGFLSFSLSVQNRRKSRAGQSLEHHLAAIFEARDISYTRGAATENRHKPDFLFPDITSYRDPNFSDCNLTMLAAKSSVKERWRQILTEANRIRSKHLLTLEPSISENQTAQMQVANLQLVVPAPLHDTFKPEQKKWLINLEEFIGHVRQKLQAE